MEVQAASSGAAGRAEITVVTPAPTTVVVTPDTVALTALGQTAQLAAEVRDQIGRVMEGQTVTWTSGDTLVATVDSVGQVTAVGAGATTVTASAGEATGAAMVKVMQAAGSVVVSPAAHTIAVGDTLRLAAEAADTNGHPVGGGGVHLVDERCFGGDGGRVGAGSRDRRREGQDRGGRRGRPGHFRDHGGESAGGAGGALRSDRRAELGSEGQLADRRTAGELVRRRGRQSGSSNPLGPIWEQPFRPDPARNRQTRQLGGAGPRL